MKPCTSCHEEKAVSEFHRKYAGYAAHCKECRSFWRKHPKPKNTPMMRFLRSCERMPNGCLEWIKAKDEDGYGLFKVDGKLWRSTRWLLGLTDPKILALHTCDNPPCVDPDHLRTGDAKKNSEDMYRKGRAWNNRREDGTFEGIGD